MNNGVQLPNNKNIVILRLTQEMLLAFRIEDRVETLTFEGEVFVSLGKIY